MMNRVNKFRYFCSKDKRFVFSDEFTGLEGFFCHFDNQSNPLQQCTGFNDINGIKVFEGDITHKGLIYWDNFLSSYQVGYIGQIRNLEIKIIGNIHENPELLEKI